jgi:hypothetical protein
MASERRVLERAEGVSLEEVSLRHDGSIAARVYFVKTLRSPETWDFQDEGEARTRFDDEVTVCRSDLLVQRRLGGVA